MLASNCRRPAAGPYVRPDRAAPNYLPHALPSSPSRTSLTGNVDRMRRWQRLVLLVHRRRCLGRRQERASVREMVGRHRRVVEPAVPGLEPVTLHVFQPLRRHIPAPVHTGLRQRMRRGARNADSPVQHPRASAASPANIVQGLTFWSKRLACGPLQGAPSP